MSGLRRKKVGNFMHPVGFGYVIIPDSEDRDKYVDTCYRKERVAIHLDDGGGVINNCYITREAIQELKFPEYGELGSAVAFIVPDFHDTPIIVGILSKSDETQMLEEESFKKQLTKDGNSVSIIGRGKKGELYIDVEAQEEGGNIYINLKNKSGNAKFNVKCFGDISLYSEGNTDLVCLNDLVAKSVKVGNSGTEELRSKLELKNDVFILTDKEGNIIRSDSGGNIHIVPKSKCNLFEGDEPLVKGSELKKQLEVMKRRIDYILFALDAGFSVATSNSKTYATAVKAVTDAIPDVENFKDINSQKSFTD